MRIIMSYWTDNGDGRSELNIAPIIADSTDIAMADIEKIVTDWLVLENRLESELNEMQRKMQFRITELSNAIIGDRQKKYKEVLLSPEIKTMRDEILKHKQTVPEYFEYGGFRHFFHNYTEQGENGYLFISPTYETVDDFFKPSEEELAKQQLSKKKVQP